MKSNLKREDDYQVRRKHLDGLSNEELKARFWDLAGKAVDPLLELATTHTSPSVERSVLLRMGFSSLEAKPLVDQAVNHGLMPKGVGHVVFRIAKENNMEIRQAGLELMEGKHWDQAVTIFKGGKA